MEMAVDTHVSGLSPAISRQSLALGWVECRHSYPDRWPPPM
jgi:hypothetical protein